MIYLEVDVITGFCQVVFRMSYETINLEKMEKSCPACEEYAQKHSVSPPKIAILACEGSCAKGEVARQAANLIAHRLASDKTVRICLGGAFTKDSGQRDLVRRADKVIAIEGCYIDCSSRMMKGVIPDMQPTVIRADRLYDAKLPFGVDEVPHEMLVLYAGEVAKTVVQDQVYVSGSSAPCACGNPVSASARSVKPAKATDGGTQANPCCGSAGNPTAKPVKATDESVQPNLCGGGPVAEPGGNLCTPPGSRLKAVIKASWDGKSSVTAQNDRGAELTIGGDKALGPVEALMASLSACVTQTMIAKLGEYNRKPEAIDITVEGERRPTPPTSFESLHVILTLRGNLEDGIVAPSVDQVMTLMCPVATTLNKAVRLTWEYRIVR